MIRKGLYILICLLMPLMSYAARKSSQSVRPDSLFFTAEFDSLLIEGLCQKEIKADSAAIDLLMKACDINPYSSVARYELGNIHVYRKNDFDTGIGYIEKAVELAPDNYFYSATLASLYDRHGDKQKAISVCESMLDKFPGRSDVLFELFELYRATQQYKNAIKVCRRLEKLEGYDIQLGTQIVSCYVAMGDLKSANKEVERLIKQYPLYDQLLVFKGYIVSLQGDHDGALALYEESLKMNPENGYALYHMLQLYDTYNQTELFEQTLYRWYAAKDVSFGDKSSFLKYAINFLSRYPDAQARIEKLYRVMVDSDDNNGDAHALLAYYLLETNREDEGIEELHTAVYKSPKDVDLWNLLLQKVSSLSDSVQTRVILKDALDAIPESPLFYYYAGILSAVDNDYPTSKRYYLQAIDRLDGSGFEALKQDIFSALGGVLYEIGEKDSAYFYMNEAISMMTNGKEDLASMNNYAYFLAVDGIRLDEAEKYSYITITRDPLQSIFLDTYAYIKFRQGQYSVALFYIERAMEYASENVPLSELYEHYGDILSMLDRADDAVEMWRKALDGAKNPDLLKRKINDRRYYEK